MKKIIAGLFLLLVASVAHGQTIQCQPSGTNWANCPLNASVQLFSTVSATGTHTSSAMRVYNNTMTGSLLATWASITGSPATCTFQVKSGDSLGNLINNGGTISVTPSNGTTAATFLPAPTQQVADEVSVVYACGTYPTAGTLSLEFVPATVTTPYSALPFDLSATAATNVKASAGHVYGWFGFNPNASTCYLQFYNSTSASLGTGALHPFGVAAGASFNVAPGSFAFFNLTTGISTGQTTTATGSTQCGSAMIVTILYD